MKKSDNGKKVFGAIVILAIIVSVFGGVVSAVDLSGGGVTQSVTDVKIQTAVGNPDSEELAEAVEDVADDTVKIIEFADQGAELGLVSSRSSYDPQAAVNYADSWWNGRNPNYHDYSSEGGDCANFVSQCLIAGGLDLSGHPGADSWGCIPSCTNLQDYLVNYLGATYETRPKSQAEPIWFVPGDPAIFPTPKHAVFAVTGDATHYATCNAHSTDRYHRTIQWFFDNSNWNSCTYYHIPSGQINHPPNRPTNIEPADGATGVSLTPTLSASAFSDPDPGDWHWKTWWDVRKMDDTLIWDSGWRTFDLTSTAVPSGKLDPSTTYKWRVRYMDNHGVWSEPLPIATTFTTLSENHPPNRPTNIEPADGATGVSLTPTLSASAFSDPDPGDWHWKTWWDVRKMDDTLIWDSGWRTFDLTSTTVPSGKLDPSTTYKWRVRHMDNHGVWSEPLPIATTFTTLSENHPPNRPTNIEPADGATGVSLTPTLSASAFSDPDPGDWHWKTWWDVRKMDDTLIWDSGWRTFDLTSTTVPSGKLDPSTTYKWRVRHMDNHGVWSEPLPIATTFTTLSENHPPNRPTNIEPADGATGVSLTPTLSASAFSDPDPGDWHWKTWWDVRKMDDTLIWDSGWRTFDLTSTTVPSGKLDPSTTYKWRVRHMDNHGVWSEPLPIATTFTTLSENHPPILEDGSVTPASGDISTTFTYYVTYKDQDGDAPTTKYVWINGLPHEMLICEASSPSYPKKIRVLRHETGQIDEVDFDYYVKNVLPNEWIASWDMEALKAGAMAVKTYAWYWTIHQKYPGQGYDVRDDTWDQVYNPASSHSRTDQAVEDTWNWVMMKNGEIFQAQYDSGTPGSPDPIYLGRMSQWGTQYWAESGKDWQWICQYYYDPITLSSGSYVSGATFEYSTTLSAGNHNYYFDFNDGYGHPVRLPTSETYSGPTVSTPNDPPNKPSIPSGPTSGQIGISYPYSTITTDPNSDNIYYWFDWGDGTNSGWIGPYPSGTSGSASKEWNNPGTYNVKTKAKDEHGAESSPLWSDLLPVCINGLWENDPINPCKKRRLSCTGEYEYQNKDDDTICGCTASNTLKRCYGGVCRDTGICDAATCGADATCDGKRPGDSCGGGTCDSTCKCIPAVGEDIAVFRAGWWALKYGPVNLIPDFQPADKWLAFGVAGWTPVAGDYNNDGTGDIAIFQDGWWALKYGPVNAIADCQPADKWLAYGVAGWTPVVGDYNNDGIDDIAIFQDGWWALKYGPVNAIPDFQGADKWLAYGTAGWTPVVGDYNNDDIDDIAIFQDGWWALKYGPVNAIADCQPADKWLAYGVAGWTPVVGDYNNDGIDDIAIFQDGWWALKYGPVNAIADCQPADKWLAYGIAGWTPVVGDFG